MSLLFALAFNDRFRADEARVALRRMGGEGLLETDETAIVIREKDGRLRVSQDLNIITGDRTVGHVLGLVVAAVIGIPPFISDGTRAETLTGQLKSHLVVGGFIVQASNNLQNPGSVLFVLVRSNFERRQKVMECLQYFKPRTIESDFPRELESGLLGAVARGWDTGEQQDRIQSSAALPIQEA